MQALVLIYFNKIVSTSTKLCPVSIRVSWRKKLDNGGKFTRFGSVCHPSVNVFDSSPQQALQLLEYLIKHGSERVVDDARSHISTLKMLRNFHYICDKGKDEGLNGTPCSYYNFFPPMTRLTWILLVRNRSRELVELLSDVEKIRAERRKAKANKNKYVGVGNDGFGSSFDSGYSGFGNDSLGGGGGSYSGNYSNGMVPLFFFMSSSNQKVQ